MTKKEKAELLVRKLKKLYPEVKCALNYNKPHELLIATRLSAQCTDIRVNMVTPSLFSKFQNVDSFADADPEVIENYIKSCGLYKTKAEDIVNMCIMLRDVYNGEIPDTIEELIKLPGVGRKTANLIVGDLYGKPAVVCDTHVLRLSARLGLDESGNPVKVEKTLRSLLKEGESLDFCHRLVCHGRTICSARKPECDKCELNGLCSYFLQKKVCPKQKKN